MVRVGFEHTQNMAAFRRSEDYRRIKRKYAMGKIKLMKPLFKATQALCVAKDELQKANKIVEAALEKVKELKSAVLRWKRRLLKMLDNVNKVEKKELEKAAAYKAVAVRKARAAARTAAAYKAVAVRKARAAAACKAVYKAMVTKKAKAATRKAAYKAVAATRKAKAAARMARAYKAVAVKKTKAAV